MPVEVYQALSLMFMFGMFILALLSYLNKKK
ncbi:putative holin-like toxin [Gorillibacterium sp. CAU 1737]